MSFAVIIMGSKNDWQIMKECVTILEKFRIRYEVYISSAHRSPLRTQNIVLDSQKRGAQAFVAAAGMAAHLAGSIAAHTLKPVIAVPLAGGILDGLDALLSSVQMPREIPVATVAVGKAGAINAGYLIAQIFSLLPDYSNLADMLQQERQERSIQLEKETESIRQDIQSQSQ